MDLDRFENDLRCQAQLFALYTEVQGMIAENMHTFFLGESNAYGESYFIEKAEEMRAIAENLY